MSFCMRSMDCSSFISPCNYISNYTLSYRKEYKYNFGVEKFGLPTCVDLPRIELGTVQCECTGIPLTYKPGLIQPALYQLSYKCIFVDPKGIEPSTLPCHGSMLPVYHGPSFCWIIVSKNSL